MLSPAEDLEPALVRSHLLGPHAYAAGYAAFQNDFTTAAVRGDARAESVAAAVRALAAENIPAILVGATSYVGAIDRAPGLRPAAPARLLIRAADRAAAQRALDPSAPVELAVAIPASPIPVDDLWARALPAIERDDEVLRLDPVDEAVLHLCAIADAVFVVPALDYVDARALVRRRGCDAARARERARDYGAERRVAASLAMTAALAAARDHVEWPSRRLRALPTPVDVLERVELTARRRAVAKLVLTENARALAATILFRGTR